MNGFNRNLSPMSWGAWNPFASIKPTISIRVISNLVHPGRFDLPYWNAHNRKNNHRSLELPWNRFVQVLSDIGGIVEFIVEFIVYTLWLWM